MNNEQKAQFSEFLQQLANSLDISESLYQKVDERYKAISRWLGREKSTLLQYSPEIFPQGSIQLGTVVKPITDADEYDVDLVCELQLSKDKVTQRNLKQMVGHEIKEYATSNGLKLPAEEGRRCWTLEYSDSAQFHTDILPAIPDSEIFKALLVSNNVHDDLSQHAISITDKTHPNYDKVDINWPQSNPRGYALWFRERMKTQFALSKFQLAEKSGAKISEVPDYKVKTPLQRSVQLLKRHRDILFENDQDDKPISVIITTIAAHAYRNEANIVDALISIVNGMPNYLTMKDGRAWIPNPVNPLENFADKWLEHPQREKKFRTWLETVRVDFIRAFGADNLQSFSKSLAPSLGNRSVDAILRQLTKVENPKNSKLVVLESNSNYRFDVPHRQMPQWPIRIKGNVEVVAWAERNGFRPWIFKSNSEKLPKKCSLRFEARTNIPLPYKVYWQVVNTGHEARMANGLRGGFYEGVFEKGGRERRESTFYNGTHWIECFIVKEGMLVARSGEYVVNIE